MNFLGWIMALSFVVLVMIESVHFYKATVCRQQAWLKSAELATQTLLTEVKPHDQIIDPSCSIQVSRRGTKLSWRTLPQLTSHVVELTLRGKL